MRLLLKLLWRVWLVIKVSSTVVSDRWSWPCLTAPSTGLLRREAPPQEGHRCRRWPGAEGCSNLPGQSRPTSGAPWQCHSQCQHQTSGLFFVLEATIDQSFFPPTWREKFSCNVLLNYFFPASLEIQTTFQSFLIFSKKTFVAHGTSTKNTPPNTACHRDPRQYHPAKASALVTQDLGRCPATRSSSNWNEAPWDQLDASISTEAGRSADPSLRQGRNHRQYFSQFGVPRTSLLKRR